MRRTLLVTLLTVASHYVYGQSTDAPSFEVAAIKAAQPPPSGMSVRFGCTGGPGTSNPGTWDCSFVSLADLIFRAYGLERYQFAPPDWMTAGRFNITAKVPAGTTKEQLQQMQQNLLAARFKLTLHHEQKEMGTYELTVGKSGLKMKESAADTAAPPEGPVSVPRLGKDGYPVFPPGRGGMLGFNGRFRWTGSKITAGDIVKALAGQLGRPVADATGLKGKYDIDMYWSQESIGGRGPGMAAGSDGGIPGPVASDIDAGPTIMRAIQEQLGLRLDSKKGLVDIVVVDHAEKLPVEN
jgi:uncharacterized protein (TIGR03435 family)